MRGRTHNVIIFTQWCVHARCRQVRARYGVRGVQRHARQLLTQHECTCRGASKRRKASQAASSDSTTWALYPLVTALYSNVTCVNMLGSRHSKVRVSAEAPDQCKDWQWDRPSLPLCSWCVYLWLVIAVLKNEGYSRTMTMLAHAGCGVGHVRSWPRVYPPYCPSLSCAPTLRSPTCTWCAFSPLSPGAAEGADAKGSTPLKARGNKAAGYTLWCWSRKGLAASTIHWYVSSREPNPAVFVLPGAQSSCICSPCGVGCW
jgi:hypothetical protein